MIDFGLAKKYVGENGKHNEKQKEKQFQGNMIFASKNAFNLHTLSRRDDLHSLCYLLLYLIDGDLVFLQKNIFIVSCYEILVFINAFKFIFRIFILLKDVGILN
jgi:hypothetical protein